MMRALTKFCQKNLTVGGLPPLQRDAKRLCSSRRPHEPVFWPLQRQKLIRKNPLRGPLFACVRSQRTGATGARGGTLRSNCICRNFVAMSIGDEIWDAAFAAGNGAMSARDGSRRALVQVKPWFKTGDCRSLSRAKSRKLRTLVETRRPS